MMRQFKPGDRVLVEAIYAGDSYNGACHQLRFVATGPDFAMAKCAVHPLPTDASHLRAAASLLNMDRMPGVVNALLEEAALRERLDAPKLPPTLREAAEEYMHAVESAPGSLAHELACGRLKRALAREEASNAS